MAGFVHFTDEQKDRARQTDIVSLLERQGEKVRRAGSEYEWMDGSASIFDPARKQHAKRSPK